MRRTVTAVTALVLTLGLSASLAAQVIELTPEQQKRFDSGQPVETSQGTLINGLKINGVNRSMMVGARANGKTTLQPITAAALVGTWVGNWKDSVGAIATNRDTLVFRPDSTFRLSTRKFRRWDRLAGDTLWLPGGKGYKLVLKDQQLSLTPLGQGKGLYVFRPVNAPTPKP